MRTKFDGQLSQLNVELIRMGALCEEAISDACKALLEGNVQLANNAKELEREIDQKVVELVKAQHAKALQILTENRDKLDQLAKFLYEKETITGEEFMAILNGEEKTE